MYRWYVPSRDISWVLFTVFLRSVSDDLLSSFSLRAIQQKSLRDTHLLCTFRDYKFPCVNCYRKYMKIIEFKVYLRISKRNK